MKYDKTVILCDEKGQPLKDGDSASADFLRFGTVLVYALLADTRLPGQVPDGEEKYRRYALAMKIQQASGEVELTVEEAALARRMVGLICPPIVTGRCFDLIDQKAG